MAKPTYPKPHVTLDMTGTACPGPLLGAKRILDELPAGAAMLLISDCPGTKDDLFSWLKYSDVEILGTETLARGSTGYYIRKGKIRRVSPNAVLDVRGTTCPGPILEAKKLLNGMQSGEILKLVSDCPGVQSDIEGWAAATGMTLLENIEVSVGMHEFYIRKG